MKSLLVDNWSMSKKSSSKQKCRAKNGDIFFMKSGLIKPVPLKTGATVNASWYVNTCLWQVLSEQRETRGLWGLIFHDDNAKLHRALITNEFLPKNHVEQYENAAYSPDLSPCDFFLFPKLKKQFRGIRFSDDNENANCFRTSHWQSHERRF